MRDRSQKPQEQEQAIDLTPMLDVIFIMLIFFIVTASFIKQPGIEITRTNTATAEQQKTSILIAINAENKVWIDKTETANSDIKTSILRLYTENPGSSLVIQADNQANIEMVSMVADAARNIGLENIYLSASAE